MERSLYLPTISSKCGRGKNRKLRFQSGFTSAGRLLNCWDGDLWIDGIYFTADMLEICLCFSNA